MFDQKYHSIISVGNLLMAWEEFLHGKQKKKDVIVFQTDLASSLINLYTDLRNKTYVHGPYSSFNISDPKPRNIHKASVLDRVLHHLVYKELYTYFEPRFIYDSYSCRVNKGTHRALNRFRCFARKVSKNHAYVCYVLKCDIKKFFANIDHHILLKILKRHVEDKDVLWLLGQVINSFETAPGAGLPLGNLTSQLLVNVYMHEFDMYIKQELRVKYYIRYADDFIILTNNKKYLEEILPKIQKFLHDKLRLVLHEDKVYIQNYNIGIDFLGWVHFPHHRVIRTTTRRKIIKKMRYYPKRETVNSYRTLLKHGDTHTLRMRLKIY